MAGCLELIERVELCLLCNRSSCCCCRGRMIRTNVYVVEMTNLFRTDRQEERIEKEERLGMFKKNNIYRGWKLWFSNKASFTIERTFETAAMYNSDQLLREK